MTRRVYVFTLERRTAQGIRPWLVLAMDPIGAVVAGSVKRENGSAFTCWFEHAIEPGAHAQELHDELSGQPIPINADVTKASAEHTFDVLTEIEETWRVRGLLVYRGAVDVRLRVDQAVDAHVRSVLAEEFTSRTPELLAVADEAIPR